MGVALALAALVAQAAPPRADVRAQRPAWAMAGATTAVRWIGQDLQCTQIRSSRSEIMVGSPSVSPFQGTNDQERRWGNTQIEAIVTVAAGTRAGQYDLEFVRAKGEPVSATILVDETAPVIAEVEPNNSLLQPQVLPAGSVTVTGKLDGEGADVFRFSGRAGERWRIEFFSRRLTPPSPAEICMRLRGTLRQPLRLAVDQGRDGAIELLLPDDGNYLVELFDGDNRAQPDYVYRLHLRSLGKG